MNCPDWLDDDSLDFFRVLEEYDVRYLLVGGIAVIYHGYARNTNDLDVFYERSEVNAERLYNGLLDFWDGHVPSISDKNELLEEEVFFQFGREPNRIDLMGSIPGVSFEEVWKNRIQETFQSNPPVRVNFISKNDLIRAKQAAGRDIDKADLKYLDD